MLFALGIFGRLAQAAEQVDSGHGFVDSPNSMMAGSPFTTYDASVALWVLIIGLLVGTLLVGGFLILNVGLLSKREVDRVGGRSPGDVGILKHNIWPEQQEEGPILPAEEGRNFIQKIQEEMGEGKNSERAA